MFCEQCGKQIKDESAFCGYCGTPVKMKPAGKAQQPMQSQQPAQSYQSMQSQQPAQSKRQTHGGAPAFKKESGRKRIFIGAAAGLLIGIAAALIAVFVPPIRERIWGSDQTGYVADADAASFGVNMADGSSEGTDMTGPAGFSGEGDAAQGDTLTDEQREELERIDALAAQAADYLAQAEVLQQYDEFAAAHSLSDFLAERVRNLFSDYQEKFLEHIAMLEGQEVSTILYIQMKADYTEALDLAAKLSEIGMTVDAAQIEENHAALPQTYKERYIQAFTEIAGRTQAENGVVSRSALWALMEGVEELEFYVSGDPEDILSRCYMAAYVLHMDSELEALNDDILAYQMVCEAMEAADYNPLLIYYYHALRSGNEMITELRDEVSLIMANYGYDFFSRDAIGMRNFVYEFSIDGSEQAVSCRSEIRECMRTQFSE